MRMMMGRPDDAFFKNHSGHHELVIITEYLPFEAFANRFPGNLFAFHKNVWFIHIAINP
jgi:hypothetical protein